MTGVSFKLMQLHTKRALAGLLEVFVLALGILASMVLAAFLVDLDPALPFVGLIGGLALTVACLLKLRRKLRSRRTAWQSLLWNLSRIERQAHPCRARGKKIAFT